LELLSGLENNNVDLIFLDPQYEKVSTVLKLDYPLYPQSDYQIMRIMEQVGRVLKPSAFCLLWINKGLLGSDRIAAWMIKAPNLRIVDCLVCNAEFCFLLQKYPTTGKRFTNRSFGTVWEENSLPTKQRKHPHQKPKELIRALLEATTKGGDLVVDPCAGSFIVLEVCQELGRDYLGCDLTFKEMSKFQEERN
ncbi:14549_t:CDS:2, partial [Racocetra persica]